MLMIENYVKKQLYLSNELIISKMYFHLNYYV